LNVLFIYDNLERRKLDCCDVEWLEREENKYSMSKGNKTKVLDLDYSYFLYKSRHHHCIVQLSLQEITKQREISPKIQNPKSTTQSAIINQTSQQSDRGEQIFYGRPLSNNSK
jgi:hypothetical protein